MHTLARGFSRQHGITHFTTTATHHPSPTRRADLPTHRATGLHQYNHSLAELPSCVTPSLDYYPIGSHALHASPEGSTYRGWLASKNSSWTRMHGYGNINPLSIDYACRPRLRPRLTLGGRTFPRNPWSSGGRDSHSSLATHACILTPTQSTPRLRGRFTSCRTLPYPTQQTLDWHGFGGALQPRYIVGAGPLDQ